MERLLDRRAFTAGLLTAGPVSTLLLSPGEVMAAPSPSNIVVHNDYNARVKIHLYHADALDRRFATWWFDKDERSRLDFDGKDLNISNDWGIQVEFENKVLSRINRVCNVSNYEDKDGKFVPTGGRFIVKASMIYNTEVKYSKNSEIKEIDGYDIDNRFGREKNALLKNALAYFYERFCQNHWRVLPELGTKAGTRFSDNFPTDDFKGVDDSREYMERQFIRMSGETFPHVKLEYGYEQDGDWLARAYYDKVRVYSSLDEGFKERFKGSFEIEINDHFVNNARVGRHYTSAEYWAGVIAHEALHNLGHGHPPRRSDQGYYQYQMILIEYLVMTNGQIRYGNDNPTPVLCRPRPL